MTLVLVLPGYTISAPGLAYTPVALGSELATIGLTIPAVVIASEVFNLPVILGLAPKDVVLLGLTFIVGTITLGTGRTSIMQGAVQLVVFAAVLFLSLVP